jgi:hypothetical protein
MTLLHPMCPPVDTTRRRFLTQAAGVAAAGAVLALATSALARPQTCAEDPIFAAIELYKAAAKAEADAEADFARREKILLETVGQTDPSIGVIRLSGNPRGPGYGQQVTAYSHEQIDALCPPDQFPDMNRMHRAWFDDLAKKHQDIMGAAEQVRQDAAGPAYDALEALLETIPTTIGGVLALVDWQREAMEADSQVMDASHCAMVCYTVADALRGLPNLDLEVDRV